METLATLLAAVLLLETASATDGGRPADSVNRRVIVVATWIGCDSNRPDLGLKPIVEAETKELVQALKDAAIGLDPDDLLWNPSRDKLLDRVRAIHEPLWLIYSGHGGHEHARSVMCLPGPDLAITDLIDQLPPGATASFWFNACLSAAVDVARPGTSVFSASPLLSRTAGNGTLMGAAITRAILGRTDTDQPTDANCDGLVTDRELFEATNKSIRTNAATRFPPRPKLLQQTWTDIPLFAWRVPRSGCRESQTFEKVEALHPELRDALERERHYRNGTLSVDEREPPVVWVTRAAKTPLPGAITMGPDEADWLAQALLSSRVWEMSLAGRRPAIRDLRDPQLPWLWQGAPGAALPTPSRQLERDLLRIEPEPSGGDGRRYARPLTPTERQGLVDEGFVACGCKANYGQCFCRSNDGKGVRK